MINIRKAEKQDIPVMAAIEEESSENPWNAAQLLEELEFSDFAYLIVAETEGEVVGFCSMHIASGDAHINELTVARKYQRLGAGTALVEHCIRLAKDSCESVTLEVRGCNVSARELYLSCGFKNIGERKDFYTNPSDDAIVMEYEISGE